VINGNELCVGLNHEIDDRNHSWQYGYFFSPTANTSASSVLKQICIWLDYPINYYNEYREVPVPKPGHPNHVPIAIPSSGTYSNWMVIRGIHTNQNAWEPPSQLTVYGFWLNDPRLVGIGSNTYVTSTYFITTYFRPITVVGDVYYGKYLALTDPPRNQPIPDMTQCQISYSSATNGFTGSEVKVLQNARISTGLLGYADSLVIHKAREFVRNVVTYDTVFSSLFDQCTLVKKPIQNGAEWIVVFSSPVGTQFTVNLDGRTGEPEQFTVS
jgi:hypothetical protein